MDADLLWVLRRRQIAFARADGHAGALHAHEHAMDFSVERGGRESEHVLAVELAGDARKCRREIAALVELEISAAGFFSEAPEV